MNEASLNLLRLHDIDAQILEAERLLKVYPAHIKSLQNAAQGAHANLDRANEALMRARASRALLETEIKQKQETIKKFLAQQMQVKSNKEFQAITHQVETIQGEIGDKETEVIEALEKEDALEMALSDAKETVKHADREVENDKERLGVLEKEKKEQLKRLKSERATWAAKTPQEMVEDYEDLFDRYPGNAIVPETGNACGGCHMNLLASTIQQLHESEGLVPCPHCRRLLYPPEAASEAHIR